MKLKLFLVFIVVNIVLSSAADDFSTADTGTDDVYTRGEALDPLGKYQLEWSVNLRDNNSIIGFNVTVETRGYVGFGLSDNGKMSGADIAVGGVFPNGQTYFSDRHAVASQFPDKDVSQDWTLNTAWENSTHTFLSFSRKLDTCDPQDYPITEDRVAIIWSYGERDELLYHNKNRGVFHAYLLSPNYSLKSTDEIVTNLGDAPSSLDTLTMTNSHVWTVNTSMQVPADDTSYWCTLHKAPELPMKHHAIGMKAQFGSNQSQGSIRHIIVHKCNVPLGRNQSANELFSNFIFPHHPGQKCFNLRQPTGPVPTDYCTELFMVWSMGSAAFFNPYHVGFPFGDTLDEYYLVQMQYHSVNNNNVLLARQKSQAAINVTLDLHYTSKLRQNEGGILNVRHTTPGRSPSLLIPPSSITHKIYGICGTQCTREILPGKGIHIYGLLFHSHGSGRKMKLHQFRQHRELPWVAHDSNFDKDYRQAVMLSEERTVLPWDVLVINCEYDNTWTNVTVVGGYSPHQEVCGVYLFYYNKMKEYQECSSEIGSPEFRRSFFGIKNITWSTKENEFLVADKHHQLAGMRISHVADNHVDWSDFKRRELQKFQLTSRQVNWCYPEVYAGGPVNTPESELVPPRPKRQRPPSRTTGRRRRKRQVAPTQAPTAIPRYGTQWQDPRRFAQFPENLKAYLPPKRYCALN